MARKRANKKPKDTILVVCSNEQNALYFSQMRKDCRFGNMNVRCVEDAKDLEDFITIAGRIRNKGKFSRVWAHFDWIDFELDGEKIREMEPLAKRKRVSLAWANPTMAIWYLLHLQMPRGFVAQPELVEQTVARKIPGYESSAEYMLAGGLSLHLSLFANRSTAAKNASEYNRFAEQQIGIPAINMVRLINDITDVCGRADLTHNQRTLKK